MFMFLRSQACHYPRNQQWKMPQSPLLLVLTRLNRRKLIAKASSCPHAVTQNHKPPPKLVEVPALPFIGSMLTWYNKNNMPNLEQPYLHLPRNRELFGDFFHMGVPGFGVGLFSRVYYMTDANEYMKVLRQEGQYPLGAVSSEWPLIMYLHSVESSLMDKDGGFFGRGLQWKRQRRFLQTDLLSPTAANGYVPGMVQAAQEASKGLMYCSSDVSSFMVRCSFDLFSSVMFGELTKVANSKSNPDPDNIRFCDATVAFMGTLFPMMLKPHLRLLLNLGFKPKEYAFYEKHFDISRKIANAKLEAFREKKEKHLLNELESSSYFSRAIDRMKSNPESLSDKELSEISSLLLVASVDTTSSILSWCIVHLAMNQEVQQTLYQEISSNLRNSEMGMVSEAILTKAASPYLHAFLRENHRMTPAVTISLIKDNAQSDVEIHGITIPKGNQFALDSYSIGMDPEYVPDYDTFRPERWLEDEVKKRVGTQAEMIDHPLYRDPFSAGSRKCPGSRVATNEVLVMISQLMLDWEISFADESIKSLDDIQHFQGLTVQPRIPALKVSPRVQYFNTIL